MAGANTPCLFLVCRVPCIVAVAVADAVNGDVNVVWGRYFVMFGWWCWWRWYFFSVLVVSLVLLL